MEEVFKFVSLFGGFGGICFTVGASIGYCFGKDKVRNITCDKLTILNNGPATYTGTNVKYNTEDTPNA